jgi:ribosomal protein S1
MLFFGTQMEKHIQAGALVEGMVKEIHPYGVQIQIRNTDLR